MEWLINTVTVMENESITLDKARAVLAEVTEYFEHTEQCEDLQLMAMDDRITHSTHIMHLLHVVDDLIIKAGSGLDKAVKDYSQSRKKPEESND